MPLVAQRGDERLDQPNLGRGEFVRLGRHWVLSVG
jgi:hypothetical protein